MKQRPTPFLPAAMVMIASDRGSVAEYPTPKAEIATLARRRAKKPRNGACLCALAAGH